ncbi:hypothetical protein KAH37_02585, partial [bacterium]|nr:hypothetical protein [bacterium]
MVRKLFSILVITLFFTISCDDKKPTNDDDASVDRDEIVRIDEDVDETVDDSLPDTNSDSDEIPDGDGDTSLPDTSSDSDEIPDGDSDTDTDTGTTLSIIYVAGDGSGDYNCDGTDDHIEINAALDFVVANSEYDTVYLKGAYTYLINDSIYISANTILEGDENAVIKLVNNADWQTQYKPLIGQKGTKFIVRLKDQSVTTGNITIRGFELDGNRSNQSEPAGASYYRMIQLQNSYNVTINDMYIHHGLADGIILEWSADASYDINSKFYNNRIHYDGH